LEKIRTTFPGELENYNKLKTVTFYWRRLGTANSEGRLAEFVQQEDRNGIFGGRLGTIVPVSNPVPQRLTVFSENASFFKKKGSLQEGVLNELGTMQLCSLFKQ